MRKGSRLVFFAAFVAGILIGQCSRSMFAAEWVTGNMLLQSITSEDKIENGIAMGYIMGVHDRAETQESCTPNGVTAVQVTALVVRYMKAHPEKQHNSADRIISTVLKETFPCPETLEGPGVDG